MQISRRDAIGSIALGVAASAAPGAAAAGAPTTESSPIVNPP